MEYKSATDGAAAERKGGTEFELELLGLLRERLRVRPTSFLGGLFIGRDSHTMGDHSVIWCAALVGKVSLAHYTTYKEAWSLSRKVRKTLNREGIVPAADVLAFRANTSAMVTLLKGCFGWSRFPLSCTVSCSTQKVFLISFPSFPPPSCSTEASLGCPSYIFCARLLWSRFFILYVVQTSGKVKHNLEKGVKEKRDRLSRG